GCGDVGSALARMLLADGAIVHGLRRNVAALPAGVLPVPIDLRRRDDAGSLPPRVTSVVFSAAADASDEASYRSIYVEGFRNLLDGLVRAGASPSRLVFTSSTGVYGQTDGSWVDEASPTAPRGFSGTVMLEAEALVAQWAASRGAAAASIRLGGIYGPGRTRLVDLVRSGRATCREGEPSWTNRIHVEDAAGAVRHLLRLSEAPDGTWVGVDDHPADSCEVYDWLADLLGVARPRRVPGLEDSTPGDGPAPNKRCSNRRLRQSGYRFRFPSYLEGYAAMLEGAG
ncbi:MAG: NAD-dependent epimerase/dehydratase family protein, partial [Alphaproteobacteria bacterium]